MQLKNEVLQFYTDLVDYSVALDVTRQNVLKLLFEPNALLDNEETWYASFILLYMKERHHLFVQLLACLIKIKNEQAILLLNDLYMFVAPLKLEDKINEVVKSTHAYILTEDFKLNLEQLADAQMNEGGFYKTTFVCICLILLSIIITATMMSHWFFIVAIIGSGIVLGCSYIYLNQAITIVSEHEKNIRSFLLLNPNDGDHQGKSIASYYDEEAKERIILEKEHTPVSRTKLYNNFFAFLDNKDILVDDVQIQFNKLSSLRTK